LSNLCRFPILLAAVWLVCALLHSHALAGGEFKRFPETVSPDGNYCLAWGVKDKPEDDAGALVEVPFGGDLNYEKDVENYLIDVKKQKVIATIPDFGYFSDGTVRQNHHDLTVGWSPDSRFAVAIYDGRYGYESAAWIDVNKRKVVPIGERFESVLRGVARQKNGKKAESERVYMSFKRPVFQSADVLLLDGTLSGFVSKFEDAGDDFSYRLKIRVPDVSQKSALRLLASRELDDKQLGAESSVDDGAVESELNRAYGELRSKLDATGKEKLKSEELVWLKLREAMPSEAKKIEFTRRRIGELRGRTENL
jgi:uncharacterized protein YecT (DUF1311 family)